MGFLVVVAPPGGRAAACGSPVQVVLSCIRWLVLVLVLVLLSVVVVVLVVLAGEDRGEGEHQSLGDALRVPQAHRKRVVRKFPHPDDGTPQHELQQDDAQLRRREDVKIRGEGGEEEEGDGEDDRAEEQLLAVVLARVEAPPQDVDFLAAEEVSEGGDEAQLGAVQHGGDRVDERDVRGQQAEEVDDEGELTRGHGEAGGVVGRKEGGDERGGRAMDGEGERQGERDERERARGRQRRGGEERRAHLGRESGGAGAAHHAHGCRVQRRGHGGALAHLADHELEHVAHLVQSRQGTERERARRERERVVRDNESERGVFMSTAAATLCVMRGLSLIPYGACFSPSMAALSTSTCSHRQAQYIGEIGA